MSVNLFKRTIKSNDGSSYQMWYFNYYYCINEKATEKEYKRSSNFSTGIIVNAGLSEQAEKKELKRIEKKAEQKKAKKEELRKKKRDTKSKNKYLFSNYFGEFFGDNCPYYEARKSKKLSLENKKQYRRILMNVWMPVFKNKDIRDITTKDVESYIHNNYEYQDPDLEPSEWTEEALSGRTLNGYFELLNLIYKEMNRVESDPDISRINPVTNVIKYRDVAKKKEILTTAEFNKIFRGEDSLKFFNDNVLLYTFSLLAGVTGCRRGELQGLRVCDVDFDKNIINLNGNYSEGEFKKGNRSTKNHNRMIPMFNQLRMPLLLCIDALPGKKPSPFVQDERFIFSYSDNKPISPPTIQVNFKEAICKALKIDEDKRQARQLTFHSLRHYAKTYLTEITNDNESLVSGVMGHSLRSKRGEGTRYYHLSEKQCDALRKIHDEGHKTETVNQAI